MSDVNKIKGNVLDASIKDLSDIPNYTGNRGRFLRVADDEQSAEFVFIPTAPDPTGHLGEYLVANADGDGVEYQESVVVPLPESWMGRRVLKVKEDGSDVEWREDNTAKIEELNSRLAQAEISMIDLEIETNYILGRDLSGDIFIDTFTTDNYISNFETSSNKPAEIMYENDFNNNWDLDDVRNMWKPGKARPKKQHFMLEVVDQYNLYGIGQGWKCDISYDPINDCYWFIGSEEMDSSKSADLVKLSTNFKDGKVEVIGKWRLDLPATGGEYSSFVGVSPTLDGNYLFLLYTNNHNTSSNRSGLAKCSVNSDGTLGVNNTVSGGTLTWEETWSASSDFIAMSQLNRDNNRYYPSCAVWDSTHIAVLRCGNSSAETNNLVAIDFYEIADDGAGALQTGSPRAQIKLDEGSGSGTTRFLITNNFELGSWGIHKEGDTLWLKTNQYTDNYRRIFKINISDNGTTYDGDIVGDIDGTPTSPSLFKYSGQFDVARSRNPRGSSVCKEGITVGKEGDILEVVSDQDSANGKSYIARRALKNALWAENQISGGMLMTQYGTAATKAVCIDGDYIWWSTNNGVQDAVRMYRKSLVDGSESYVTITGGWYYSFEMCLADVGGTEYAFIVGQSSSGTNGSLAIQKSLLVSNLGGSVSVASGNAFASYGTDTRYGICSDGTDYLYLTNDTDNTIERWNVLATPTLDSDTYISIHNAEANWTGIEWKNNQLYVIENMSSWPYRIWVIKDEPKDTAYGDDMFMLHRYQDPSRDSGIETLSFKGNDLYILDYTSYDLFVIKTLEDPDVLQLQSYVGDRNVALSSDTNSTSGIKKRTFDPKDYKDKRDIPDEYFIVAAYGDEGFTIFHLDEFLSNYNSSGLHRYNVEDIRIDHYKRGGTTAQNQNLFGRSSPAYNSVAINVHEDIIYVSLYNGSDYATMRIINLVEGWAMFLNSGTADGTGRLYQGALSERNDGKGYGSAPTNTELALRSNSNGQIVFKIHAHTFRKEDLSNYNGKNPATFVALSQSQACDLLRIDWDENGNRTPTKIWNQAVSATNSAGQRGTWIAPSGTWFLGYYTAQGQIIVADVPVWEISGDAGTHYGYEIGTNICGGYVLDISPNSRCWKTKNGWRHQLFVGVYYSSATRGGFVMVDVENETRDDLLVYGGNYYGGSSIDNFEDLVFGAEIDSDSSGYAHGIAIMKKIRFHDDTLNYVLQDTNNSTWSIFNHSHFMVGAHRNCIDNQTRPRMAIGHTHADGSSPTIYSQYVKYNREFNILSNVSRTSGTNGVGLQFMYFPEMEDCFFETETLECDNPEAYIYKKTQIAEEGKLVEIVDKDDVNVTYTDGDTETWTIGTNENYIGIDGTTEGYLEWDVSGIDGAGIKFTLDDDSGVAEITVYDDTLSATLSAWDAKAVDLWYDEDGTPNNGDSTEHVVWIANLDSTHDYTITVRQGAIDNSGTNDYIRIKNFYKVNNLVSGNVETKLQLWHTASPASVFEYTLVEDTQTDIIEEATFAIAGNEYTLSGDDVASQFVEVSGDGGTTWLDPDDPTISWGTNNPDYDDNIITNGYFTVKFDTTPTVNVIIRFVPRSNRYKIIPMFKHPYIGSTIDTRKNIRLIDHALELY